jgi:hypothetical protein
VFPFDHTGEKTARTATVAAYSPKTPMNPAGITIGHELVTVRGALRGAAFVEGVAGEDSFHGIWGGLKFYFGRADKPLIARHRQDDPKDWTTDTLFSITNNNTGSANTTSSQFCPPGVPLVGGECQTPR